MLDDELNLVHGARVGHDASVQHLRHEADLVHVFVVVDEDEAAAGDRRPVDQDLGLAIGHGQVDGVPGNLGHAVVADDEDVLVDLGCKKKQTTLIT